MLTPKPDTSDAGMIPSDSPEGPTTVRFDAAKHANYHLNMRRERVYHEKPPGFRFNANGELYSVGLEEGEAPVREPVSTLSGAPVEKEDKPNG